MRRLKRRVVEVGLCESAVALVALVSAARADVVTEKSASILVFPKVVVVNQGSDPGDNTTIQITNTSNSMIHAHCFYVDARLPIGCRREDERIGCVPIWQETDFTIWLTRQQPTHWNAATGRPVDPTDDFTPNSDGAGFDPGAVPPLTAGFVGELRCVEVDLAGSPTGGNHLKGEATIIDRITGDVEKYNGIGIQGTAAASATCPDDEGRCILQLNNPRGESTGEYNACPQTLILNHFADGASEPVLDEFNFGEFGFCQGTLDQGDQPVTCLQNSDCAGIGSGTCIGADLGLRSSVVTELTLVPCSADFERQVPGRVTVQFLVINEFEERFSASTTVTCWKSIRLGEIDAPNNTDLSVFSATTLGTTVAQTRITPADTSDGAVIGIAETTHQSLRGHTSSRAAVNLHTEGDRIHGTDFAGFDQIVLPTPF